MKPDKLAERFLLGVIIVQIVVACIWMFFNVGTKPSFGDAGEYFNLSKSLVVDEYRPILYPMVVGAARILGDVVHIPYLFYLYVFQAAVSLACITYAIRTVYDLFLKDLNIEPWILRLAALYIWTFPLVCFLSFAGMADSLALSMTLLFLSAILRVLNSNVPGRRPFLLLFVSFVLGGLVRGDRPYLFLVFGTAASSAVLLARWRTRRKAASLCLLTLLLSFAVVVGVDRTTQKPGCYGRPRTTFEFVLLDRIVWPHMTECYTLFPERVRNAVTLADAKKFDENNNNVMYVFAKKMNRKFGEKHAHLLYRDMAKTVFREKMKSVVHDIMRDIAITFFAPFSQLAEVYNVNCHSKSPCINPYCYNPRCFMLTTKWLTWVANAIPLHLFAISFLVFLVRTARSPSFRRSFRCVVPVLLVYFGFSLTMALFYGLGDGFHPNSRYSIAVDVSWVMLLLILAAQSRPASSTSTGDSPCGRS